MPRTALITGINGQDGYYLGQLLLSQGYAVIGCGHSLSPSHDQMSRYVCCDISNLQAVDALISEAQPHEIYNLAVFLSGDWKEKDEQKARAVNVEGVRHLLSSMRAHAPKARLFQASSAYIFKSGPPPKNEVSPIEPANFHAQTKYEAMKLVNRAREEGVFAVNGHLFNHESPRRPPQFLMPKVCQAAADFKTGRRTAPLLLGDLRPVRDWGYAGDFVQAMHFMLKAPFPRDYVIATGVGHSVEDVCRLAFGRVGLDWRAHVTSDPALYRATEVDVSIGDPSAIQRDLGWRPKISFEHLVGLMVDAHINP